MNLHKHDATKKLLQMKYTNILGNKSYHIVGFIENNHSIFQINIVGFPHLKKNDISQNEKVIKFQDKLQLLKERSCRA